MTNTHRTVEVPLVPPVAGGTGGRGFGNIAWSSEHFGDDVTAWRRSSAPGVEYYFSWFDMDDNEHAVSRHLNVEQAYALAQRLLSAVESASRGPGSLPLVVKEPDAQAVSDAASVDSMLSAVVKAKKDTTQNTTSLKIHLVKALRWARFGDAGAREHDARLAAVLRLWTGYTGDASGLLLAKLVVEAWMSRNSNLGRTQS
jgi:hypothetical protein